MKILPFMLDNRLAAIADNIIKDEAMVDVGTDHAYLPVWLTRRGICPKALAVDINEEPLMHANITIEKYRATELVETRLSDGLINVPSDFAKNIVIAGMGGDVISGILDNSSWISNSYYNILLQPMTCHERLRKYLYESGFDILSENIVCDKQRYYTIMKVSFSGNKFLAPLYKQYSGSVNVNDTYGKIYLQRQVNRLNSIADGIEKSGKNVQLVSEHRTAANQIASIINNKEA